jgi:uncharacterized protein YlxW (UPF0749 family)
MSPETASLVNGLARFSSILNAGLICSLLALIVKYRLENRKLSITENTGLRSEFIAEMRELRDEVKGLRVENAQLREEVSQLHAVIDGMRRSSLGEAISEQRVIVDSLPDAKVSPTIKAAAVRAARAARRVR